MAKIASMLRAPRLSSSITTSRRNTGATLEESAPNDATTAGRHVGCGSLADLTDRRRARCWSPLRAVIGLATNATDGDLEQLLPVGVLVPFSAPSSQKELSGAPTGGRFEKDVAGWSTAKR